MTDNRASQSELVLSQGEYAYTQDLTNGIIKVHTGPNVVNSTNQEYPVNFDLKQGRFVRVELAQAAHRFAAAKQGQYMVLTNPAKELKQPDNRDKAVGIPLEMGQKVNIQGPTNFALWPGQSVEVINGHNLRSNQYLLVRVYDEDTARNNWSKGVVRVTSTQEGDSKDPKQDKGAQPSPVVSNILTNVPEDLAVGKLYVIRGDQVSFYIPPTGVEVVANENGDYVRNAVTLERLEYCILIDEDGNKRYERGPKVEFPKPTERFHTELTRSGERQLVFKPIELNEIQGIHIKVNSGYVDDVTGQTHKEGDELFIRGSDTPIYFPKPEHSLVSYDGKHKHFATAVPEGEARYVLERKTGKIRTVKGPMMLLPDPRDEVIVRRVLSDKQCMLWYPGNDEAKKYNATLRDLMRTTPTTRGGSVSEGEVTRSRKLSAAVKSSSNGFADKSNTHSDSLIFGAEEFSRQSTYTEPRTITFQTKFSGVPSINVFTGYSVMVIDKQGNRRVELGPRTLQLEYDESLEVIEMSTGKPKNTDAVKQTVYLRVKNNQVGDIIYAETADHVNVSIKVSLRVNFVGSTPEERSRWFEAENYVKLLCDHVRSLVKAAIRKMKIEELYADQVSVIRDAILGPKQEGQARRGLRFEENGMEVIDAEVLSFNVMEEDGRIGTMLNNAQHNVVESTISLGLQEKKLELDRRTEEIEQERVLAQSKTARIKAQLGAETDKYFALLESERIARNLDLTLEKITAAISESVKRAEQQKQNEVLENAAHEASMKRQQANANFEHECKLRDTELSLSTLKEETKSVVERFAAAQDGFSEALLALGNQETLVKVTEAMSVQNFLGGKNFVEVVQKVLDGTPIQGLLDEAVSKAAPQNGTTRARSKSARSN